MGAFESHERPSSSSSYLCRRWRYDVYLSFSVNGTLKNMAVELYMAMKGAGVNVFIYDKELQVGESISEKPLEAIKDSLIAVVLLSKDYAASSWCLEEFATLLECSGTFPRHVIPLIYSVEMPSFAEVFNKLQGRFAADKMSRWKKAISVVTKLESFDFIERRGRDEKESIQSLVKEVVEYIQDCKSEGYYYKNQGEIVDYGSNGRKIGKLTVSDKEIAKGSNGTIVFEGTYSGRVVAVKRLLKAHHDVAFKEIQNLIESDQHRNIVRLYGDENDQDFVYLALEKCTCSLADLIQIYSNPSQNTQFSHEYKDRLDSMKGIIGVVNLWKANGRPSPLLLELMRNMVVGLVHLHKLKIIHRDIKPQNVLIKKEEPLLAKLCDMGISKRLQPDISSLGPQATVCGTSGWKAPERLLHGRQTRALDLFSLGCVLFFCITGGRHPFGDHFERDYKIVYNQVDLSAVEYIPEAVDLFSHLLNHDPELRPKASEVLHHPLFWDYEKRLSFVRDTSDRVESEAKETNSNLLKALENIKPLTFGAQWNTEMDPAFIANIGLRRGYKFDSVRDLMRVMRNKLNHYIELPKEIKEILGPVPEGFDDYFASRFPRLLIEAYKVVGQYCQEEEWFQKYYFMCTVVNI